LAEAEGFGAGARSDGQGGLEMAHGYQKSNHEKRKPKAEKPKPVAQTSPFERGPGMSSPKRTVKKKGR
jgi:hypothetical protein